MTGTVKHHRFNQDLWQRLEAANQLAANNPDSSALAEVRAVACTHVNELREALRRAHAQEQANAPVSDVEESIRRYFHRRLPLALHMKDVVDELKAALADADELLRQANASCGS